MAPDVCRGRPVFRARLATRPADIDAALALRHEIYVRRMKILPEDHEYVDNGRLVDPLDATSHHLLLWADDEVVGTARFTCARESRLEIEDVRDVSPWLADRDPVCEVTRLMILKEYRCWPASMELFWGFWKAFQTLGVHQVLAAGKVGSLGRYYEGFGLRVVDPEPFAYPVVPGATYQLMLADFGRPRSLRRTVYDRTFGLSYQLGSAVPGLVTSVYRRGRRNRHISQPEVALSGGTP